MIKRQPIILMVALSALAAPAAIGLSAVDKPDKLPIAQQRQLQKLVQRFRLAKARPDERQQIVDEALKLGPIAARVMRINVEKDLLPQLKRYGADFQRASQRGAEQVVSQTTDEISELRATVLGLKDRGDFSKELIKAEADPAMKQLEQLLVVDRQKVLADNDELIAARKRILAIGQMWRQCRKVAGEAGDDDPSFTDYLAGEERLAAQMAMPMDKSNRKILLANARTAGRLQREEARAIMACNLTRVLLGLDALAIDLKLCAASRDHSQDMHRLKFFSHTSPVEGKRSPGDRAKRFKTSWSGENIHVGSTDGRHANDSWFHSPGHHRNMLGRHRRIGVGVSGKYFTQMFGK